MTEARRTDPKTRLDDEQALQMIQALFDGPVACGFSHDLSPLPRIAALIEDLTGINDHPGHVSRLLHALHCWPIKPVRATVDRDDERIEEWKAEDAMRVLSTRWSLLGKTSKAKNWPTTVPRTLASSLVPLKMDSNVSALNTSFTSRSWNMLG